VVKTLDDIRSITEYKEFGHYIMLRCPFHDDKNPSLQVSEKRYICKSCDEKGSLDKLHAVITGIPEDRKTILPSGVGKIFPEYEFLDQLDDFCYDAHKRLLRNSIYQVYLKRRGIASAIPSLKLGYAGGWYTIPIYNPTGDVVGAMARAGEVTQEATNKRFTLPHGQHSMLYVPSWNRVREQDVLYVTYGPIDAISLWVLGYASASPSSGKDSTSPEWFDEIRKKIIFLPDDGEYETAMKHAMKLGWRGDVQKLDYPTGMKDPNDFLKAGKEEVLRGQLDKYKSLRGFDSRLQER
jgi:DNA primase